MAPENKRKIYKDMTVMICFRGREPVKLLRSIYPQIYKWYKKYALVASGDCFVIVVHPNDAYGYAGVDKNVDVETVKRLTYLKQHILTSRGLVDKSIQRGTRYMLVLTNISITSDANRVSYSLTRAQFVVITGLLNIELLGLQDGYLVGEMTKVNSEWEAARNESLVGGQGNGDVTCNC